MSQLIERIKGGLRTQEWNMQTIAWTLVLVFIILQAFGILFEKYVTIKMGPVLLFALITITVLMAASIVRKQWGGRTIEKKDFFALVMLITATILAVIYLKGLVPQIFSTAAEMLKHDLQTIFPLP